MQARNLDGVRSQRVSKLPPPYPTHTHQHTYTGVTFEPLHAFKGFFTWCLNNFSIRLSHSIHHETSASFMTSPKKEKLQQQLTPPKLSCPSVHCTALRMLLHLRPTVIQSCSCTMYCLTSKMAVKTGSTYNVAIIIDRNVDPKPKDGYKASRNSWLRPMPCYTVCRISNTVDKTTRCNNLAIFSTNYVVPNPEYRPTYTPRSRDTTSTDNRVHFYR